MPPQPFFDRLVATVEQLSTTRSILRQVVALAGDAPGLSDEQLRDRLTALAQACARDAAPKLLRYWLPHLPARLTLG